MMSLPLLIRAVGALLLVCLIAAPTAYADPADDLVIEDLMMATRLDLFGLETPLARGFLLNTGTDAYQNITLFAEVYDADDNLIGEGMGFPVTACGEGLVFDFTLQPGASQSFEVPLDIFEAEAEIDRVAIIPQATATDPDMARRIPQRGIRQITDRETVAVEWIDDATLRYSPGCWRDIFSARPWYQYDVAAGLGARTPHPRLDTVTPALQSRLSLTDPLFFSRSFLTFAPGERRAVYPTDLNTLVTIEPDGSFPRVLYDRLYTISLQGVYFPFSSGGTFIAYYHGGFGDPVRFLTANADGRQLSQHPLVTEPSLILPGVSPNGQRVIVGATVNDVTGYYLRATNTNLEELLLEADLPGNNWPPPVYQIDAAANRYIYLARPVEGEARLQCLNVDTRELVDMTALPLNLASNDRAWMWLSSDDQWLALGATGPAGGLWLIDVTQFDSCF